MTRQHNDFRPPAGLTGCPQVGGRPRGRRACRTRPFVDASAPASLVVLPQKAPPPLSCFSPRQPSPTREGKTKQGASAQGGSCRRTDGRAPRPAAAAAAAAAAVLHRVSKRQRVSRLARLASVRTRRNSSSSSAAAARQSPVRVPPGLRPAQRGSGRAPPAGLLGQRVRISAYRPLVVGRRAADAARYGVRDVGGAGRRPRRHRGVGGGGTASRFCRVVRVRDGPAGARVPTDAAHAVNRAKLQTWPLGVTPLKHDKATLCGGLVGAGAAAGGLLCSLWFSEGAAPSSLGAGAAASGGRSRCTLLCRDVPEAGISQLSVRRRDDSCIRLVATTAFMAACRMARGLTFSLRLALNSCSFLCAVSMCEKRAALPSTHGFLGSRLEDSFNKEQSSSSASLLDARAVTQNSARSDARAHVFVTSLRRTQISLQVNGLCSTVNAYSIAGAFSKESLDEESPCCLRVATEGRGVRARPTFGREVVTRAQRHSTSWSARTLSTKQTGESSSGEGFFLRLPSKLPFVSMAATARSALVLPLLLVLLPVWRTLAVLGAPQAHEASGPAAGSSNSNSSGAAAAGGAGKEGQTLSGFNADSSMVQRALYVLVAITAFGLLYFLIRAVRVKKTSPRKKYGLLARSDDALELTAAVASDDDDDNTLYEARPLRRTEVAP
ncbi:protein FAM174C [Hippocampus comes]|nr:PREDICTED: uncharacterized protein LOC109506809 [Hippocampus comes]